MLISIIVPIYNTEKYLHNCIDSIIRQTYMEIEIILINDGSTDNSGNICDEYAKKDKRIRVFHNANGGLSNARNFGVQKSNGEYVTFVDSDDSIESDFVETLVFLCKKHGADIVQCNRCYNNENKGVESDVESVYSNIEAQYLLFGKDYIPTVNSTCKLINRKIFDDIKFEEGRIHEDEIIIHRMLYFANKVVYINKRMYVVNRSENSITRSEFSLKKLDYIYALENRMLFYKSEGLEKLSDLTLYRYTVSLKKYIRQVREKFPEEKIILNQLKKNLVTHFWIAIVASNLTLRYKASLVKRMLE